MTDSITDAEWNEAAHTAFRASTSHYGPFRADKLDWIARGLMGACGVCCKTPQQWDECAREGLEKLNRSVKLGFMVIVDNYFVLTDLGNRAVAHFQKNVDENGERFRIEKENWTGWKPAPPFPRNEG